MKSFFVVDDIYYIVKVCMALHNMMVKFHMNADEEESGDFYDVVPFHDAPAAANEAVEAINSEDEFFCA